MGNNPMQESQNDRFKRIRVTSQLWCLARAAIKLMDSIQPMQKGIYGVEPAAVMKLRQACESIRPELRNHEEELREDHSL